MIAVVGYLLAISVAIPLTWMISGSRYQVVPDASFEVPEVGARFVPILGGLAGFAVTGVVLLMGQSATLSVSGRDFTNVLAMFVVAYMGLLSVAFQFAVISDRQRTPFDLAAAQFAGAAISVYFIFIGWFALRPLFLAFGLTTMADLMSWMLVGVNLAGYPLLAMSLWRSGYASLRVVVAMPAIALASAALYVIVVRTALAEGHVEGGTLALTLTGFVPGAIMYGVQSALPIAARDARLGPILAERWHLVILGYAMAVIVLVAFLLVSVIGLA